MVLGKSGLANGTCGRFVVIGASAQPYDVKSWRASTTISVWCTEFPDASDLCASCTICSRGLNICPWSGKMGTAKKEAARKERQGKVGDGMNNVKVKGENFYRYHIGLKLMQCKSIRCLTVIVQVCEESQNSEHVQKWRPSTERRRKDYKSRCIPVPREAKGPS